MTYLDMVQRPTLILDEGKVRANIQRMAAKAGKNHLRLRPHFKTHHSAQIGQWFRDFAVQTITVSSVDMARAFAAAGWTDITIAFPVNLRQIDAINQLAQSIHLGLLVESAETALRLNDALTAEVDVWLKIDAGYGRTGIHWQDETTLLAVANEVANSQNLSLQGLLTHSGNTYSVQGQTAVQALFKEAVGRMRKVQRLLFEIGYNVIISVGDTPGCSLAERFSGVDEIRPGNFVFYDLMQVGIGACQLEDIAVAVACPVVALHPERDRIIIYGGAVHFSKDFLTGEDGSSNYGRVVRLNEDGWTPLSEDIRLISLSQEHGTIQADQALFDTIKVGDLLGILPVHSCLTADLLRRYLTLDGQWIDCIPKES